MNTRIFNLIEENLQNSFHLDKYAKIREEIGKNTIIYDLPWTPARLRKFEESIGDALQFEEVDMGGTIEQATKRLDERYMSRFFGEIWQPTTDKYQYSGWALVDLINNENPTAVLDFGCGYNPFKDRIQNLIGIDPYNNQAD